MADEKAKGPTFDAVYRPAPAFDRTPFDRSAVNYEKFSEDMTAILTALGSGAVIAIDAPWGSGKTYFGRNFVALLKQSGWRTAYIDAFEFDYLEDPFIFLASAIQRHAGDAKTTRHFASAAAAVGKALLPVTAKAVIKAASAGVLDVDKAQEALTDAAAAAAEKVVEARMKEFERERQSFKKFRERVAELSAKTKTETGHPLVVFIDELDRCRPDFAVRTLERIKHLFEVPELSFVLLLHTPQLQHAVQGLYGAIDAEGYLRKFIHFTLPLPRVEVQPGKTPEVVAYVKYLGQKVSLGEAQTNVSRFVEVYGYIAPLLNMSMRDVERAFLAFILSNPRPQMYPVLVDCLACIVAIKVLRPGVYAALVRRDAAAAGEAIQMFSAPVVDGVPKYYEQLMRYVLEAHVTRNPSQDALGYWSQMRMITGPRVEHVFTMLTSRN